MGALVKPTVADVQVDIAKPLAPTRTVPAGNIWLPTVVVIVWEELLVTPMIAVPRLLPAGEISTKEAEPETMAVCAPTSAVSAHHARRTPPAEAIPNSSLNR